MLTGRERSRHWEGVELKRYWEQVGKALILETHKYQQS